MDLNKLTMGDRVIAISGIVLLIFSFFDWAQPKVEGQVLSNLGADRNGWDMTLTLLAVLLGIAMVVIVALKAFGVDLPDSINQVLFIAGVVAFVFILFKLIVGPDWDAPFDVETSRKFGFFVGTLASAGLAVGGYLTWQESKGPATTPPPTT